MRGVPPSELSYKSEMCMAGNKEVQVGCDCVEAFEAAGYLGGHEAARDGDPPPEGASYGIARNRCSQLIRGRDAEEELEVEFFFEEVGAAFGVANIFGDVATRLDLESDRTALKGGAQAEDALAVRMVEAFCDADEGG